MKTLIVEQLSKSFQNEKAQHTKVLENINFTAEEGARIALLGRSGCGKTTLLNMIAGFDMPDCGSIQLDGHPVDGPSDQQAVIFQSPALFPWMTVLQNVTYGLKRKGIKKAERNEAAAEMLAKVGLAGFEKYYPHELSGGMQQRVALARVFVMKPPLLLMDEPFAALDAQLRDQMQRLLLSLWKEYQPTVLFVTHDVEEAVRLADRILFLNGRPAQIEQTIDVTLSIDERCDAENQMNILELKETIKKTLFGTRPDDCII